MLIFSFACAHWLHRLGQLIPETVRVTRRARSVCWFGAVQDLLIKHYSSMARRGESLAILGNWRDCVLPCDRREAGAVSLAEAAGHRVRGKKLDSYVSFLILFTGLFLSVAMPLLVPRAPGPDAMTLWSSYARADNCNFWNPFSPDRSSYECSAFLLRPTGIDLTNAWAYGMFCNFFLTAIPVVVFRRMPLAIFGTLCLWGIVRSFFLENLTKEIIVSVAVLSILLSSLTRKYRGGFFLSAVYGVLIRPYWILFCCPGLRLVMKITSRNDLFPHAVPVLPGGRHGDSVGARVSGVVDSCEQQRVAHGGGGGLEIVDRVVAQRQ